VGDESTPASAAMLLPTADTLFLVCFAFANRMLWHQRRRHDDATSVMLEPCTYAMNACHTAALCKRRRSNRRREAGAYRTRDSRLDAAHPHTHNVYIVG
jgi:hypothetical protein